MINSRARICGWVAIAVISASFALYSVESVAQQFKADAFRPSIEFIVFQVIVLGLLFGNFVFQFTRLGYLKRKAAYRPAARDRLESIYRRDAPRLAILIPSYREEPRVLLQTILSAALVEYPARRVAVLIDDPPAAVGPELTALEVTRRLVAGLNLSFRSEAARLSEEQRAFRQRAEAGLDLADERERLAISYERVADWIEAWSNRIEAPSAGSAHADRVFIEEILREPARSHRVRADWLRSMPVEATQIAHEYQRLAALLAVEIESFERKWYVNLSHEPNKAMNLNSYIGLIGGSYREVRRNDQRYLEECPDDIASVRAPHADYVLTLDADSIVLPDYALRLVDIMEANPRVAVAQTPYSAFPNPGEILERAAAATTDIQYIIHQGFTHYNATYWVGANALLRLTALRDICKHRQERGHRISVFIQDRTVIEDTGSTVDLIRGGWTLHNHPERLAYSATPPDFGSLIIQRRRWSNGGLLIFPDLLSHLWRKGRLVGCFSETAVRSYYLLSPALANFGLLLLLLYRFDESVSNWWLPLAALPYYLLYGFELKRAGYRWSDLLRVYALNLLLLPVNLAGVLRSVQQALTGGKAVFGRTPKVEHRTRTPAFYILFLWALVAYLIVTIGLDLSEGMLTHASFVLINTTFYLYGISRFLGWRNCWSDLKAEAAAIVSTLRPNRAQPVSAVAVEPRAPAVQPVRIKM